MTYYHVTIEDLEAIHTALEAQSEGLGVAQSQTQASVFELDDATTRALTTGLASVTGQLESLAELLTRGKALVSSAEWTGTDADTFRTSNADLLAAIEQTNVRFAEAVEQYETSSRQLLATLDELVAEFVTASRTLQESSTDLGTAVQVEARSYQEAFDGSFAFGG